MAVRDTLALPAGFTMVPTEDRAICAFHYEDLLFKARRSARFKVLRAGEASDGIADTAFSDTLYADKRFAVLGRFRDTELCYRKYETKHQPEMYPAELWTGTLAHPYISSDPEASHWRTRILHACATEGVNFAGHYTVAEWGCGAMCQMLAVVDRMNGHVYFSGIPFDTLDGHYGVRYARDSRMILINSELVEWQPGYRLLFGDQRPSTYVWNEQRKRFELVETVKDP